MQKAEAELRFIEPMECLEVPDVPEGKDWLYELKFDGYRCLAGKDSTGVTLWSRRGNLFTDQFPHIAQACEQLPSDTMLDGEIIAIDQSIGCQASLIQRAADRIDGGQHARVVRGHEKDQRHERSRGVQSR